MELGGSAQQVWVFIGESDRWHGKPLYLAILEVLRRGGCAGGTVLRGLAGFGANSLIHTAGLVELSTDLPVVVTFVDRTERVARVLPEIAEMVREGLITVSTAEVVKYTHRVPGAFPAALTVADVMTREVVTAAPETSVGELVRRMLASGMRAVPVVGSDRRLAGIVTDGDLLARGAVHLPIAVQRELNGELPPEELARLEAQPQRAAEVMTPAPVTARPEMSLAKAAALLADHGLTRIPVLDPDDRLVGIVSRSDLLRTVAQAPPPSAAGPRPHVSARGLAGEAMRPDVVTVRRETPLAETLDRLLGVADRRVVVVDEADRPVGIITDGDVLGRAARRIHAGALRSLAAWFAGGVRPDGVEVAARDRSAADVMSGPVVTVREDAPIGDVLHVMMARRLKLVPVVGAGGELRGAISRADLLAALAGVDAAPSSRTRP
ncbi:MAG: CBS domain-containing protein [Acidobacteria bacterium]|nr:MAG: CBS domain-containing protein [Acidobacteriota bacterium]